MRATRLANRRGSSLLFTLMVLMVLTVAGMGICTTAVQALNVTKTSRGSGEAFNLAETGAELGVRWLRGQASGPVGLTSFDPFGGRVSYAGGAYRVRISNIPGDASTGLRRYRIAADGYSGERVESIEVHVQEASFGRYAYFTDAERAPDSASTLWFTPHQVVDGPVHSNNELARDFAINWQNSTAPIFTDTLSSASGDILWEPYQPQTEAEWALIFQDGSRGYRLGVGKIPLPASSAKQRNAAWGDTTGFPTAEGVYVPNDGSKTLAGIYVEGSPKVTFTDDLGLQRIEIQLLMLGGDSGKKAARRQRSYERILKRLERAKSDRKRRRLERIIKKILGQLLQTWHITVDHQTNTTRIQYGDNDITYLGTTNGVLYSTKSISGLEGTLSDNVLGPNGLAAKRNAWTVATDVADGNRITITNDLTYTTGPDQAYPWNDSANQRAASLGIISNEIVISKTAPAYLSIDALILAGGDGTTTGSFYADGWDTRGIGELRLNGGVIQKYRGPLGALSAATGQQSSGFAQIYKYDRRATIAPPPYFPTTGKYERLGWRRLGGHSVKLGVIAQ